MYSLSFWPTIKLYLYTHLYMGVVYLLFIFLEYPDSNKPHYALKLANEMLRLAGGLSVEVSYLKYLIHFHQ